MKKIYLIGLLFFLVPLATAFMEDSNSVWIDDANAFIKVYPKNLQGSGYINFELISKVYTGDIYLVLGYDSSEVKPTTLQYYKPHNVTFNESFTCEGEFNYTLSPKVFHCYVGNGTLFYSHGFDGGDLESKTAWWEVTQERDYKAVNGGYGVLNHEYDGKDTWRYKAFTVNSGQLYKGRIYMKVPTNGKTWKYDLAFFPKALSIQEAIIQNKLYLLDPTVLGASQFYTDVDDRTASNWTGVNSVGASFRLNSSFGLAHDQDTFNEDLKHLKDFNVSNQSFRLSAVGERFRFRGYLNASFTGTPTALPNFGFTFWVNQTTQTNIFVEPMGDMNVNPTNRVWAYMTATSTKYINAQERTCTQAEWQALTWYKFELDLTKNTSDYDLDLRMWNVSDDNLVCAVHWDISTAAHVALIQDADWWTFGFKDNCAAGCTPYYFDDFTFQWQGINKVNLISPSDGSSVVGDSQDFTGEVLFNDTVQNVTLYIWNSTNGVVLNLTNSTIPQNQSNITFNDVSLQVDLYKWNVLACHTDFCLFSGSNFTLDTSIDATITFRDSENKVLVDYENISLEIISDVQGSNFTVTNGVFNGNVSFGNVTFRYSSNSYPEKFHFLQVTGAVNQTFYMTNRTKASNITITVIDQNAAPLEKAVVKALRYDILTNTYLEDESGLTNFEGVVVFNLEQNTEFYRFRVEFPVGNSLLLTQPTYIYSTEVTLQVNTQTGVLEDFYTIFGMDTRHTFNNDSAWFRFEYNDPSSRVTQACVNVYTVDAVDGQTLYNNSCASGASSILFIGVDNSTTSSYISKAEVTIGGEDYFVSEEGGSFEVLVDWGVMGLLLTLFIVLAFVALAFWNPVIAAILAPIALLVTRYAGMNAISYPVVFTLMGLGFFLAFLFAKKA